jgi:hypothetical protein
MARFRGTTFIGMIQKINARFETCNEGLRLVLTRAPGQVQQPL